MYQTINYQQQKIYSYLVTLNTKETIFVYVNKLLFLDSRLQKIYSSLLIVCFSYFLKY